MRMNEESPSSRKGLSRQRLYTLLAPLAGVALFALLQYTELLERVENLTRDGRFRWRANSDLPSDPHLLLVGLDESSLHAIGRWPWSRTVHGDLARLLTLEPPSVLAFDLLFPEPEDKKADSSFADGLARHPNAILGAFRNPDHGAMPSDPGPTRPIPIRNVEGDLSRMYTAGSALLPVGPLRRASRFGFVDSEPTSSDGIRRRAPLVVRIGTRVYPSLSLQALLLHWKVPLEKVEVLLGREIRIPGPRGMERIPIDDSGSLLINYRAPANFREIGYLDLAVALGKVNGGAAWPRRYPNPTGKILIVGQTATGLTDMGPSPLSAKSPLVHIHLNVLNNVLRGDYLRVIPWIWIVPGWLLAAWLSLRLFEKSRIAPSVLIPTLLVLLYLDVAWVIFERSSVELPIICPVLAFGLTHAGAIILRWREEQRSKQQIRSVFASYIAPGVMEQLLRYPGNVRLGGVRKPVTVLFSDIRGFTSITEEGDEQELVRQLNEYFTRMVDCVNREQGTLHKYIGDAIMSVWGDVMDVAEAENARRAVRTALAMRAELVKLNETWKAEGRMPLRIGIGLNHGVVVVGNIGAPQRKEFAVIGDAVNLASRLEGVTKTFHTDLVVSESVEALLGPTFLRRTLGLILVKGKTKPVRVFEILDNLESPSGGWDRAWVEDYEKAFALYLDRRFDEATMKFETLARARPGDYGCTLYLAECRRLGCKTLPPDWDGVLVMETK